MGNIEERILKGKKKMAIAQIAILLLYLVFTISGLLLIKLGGIQQFSFLKGNLLLELNIKTMLGILCYLVSFIIYIVLISNFKLSYIMPLTTGLVYILILVASVLFLNEKLSIYQIVGAGVILLGVMLMNIKVLE